MSDSGLSNTQHQQIAASYLEAARNGTQHLLINSLVDNSDHEYLSRTAALLANAYVYEFDALKENAQSDHPKAASDIQNQTAKLIAEDRVPKSSLPISQVLMILMREGGYQSVLDSYVKQPKTAEAVR